MPNETNRVYGIKNILLPNGQKIKMNVITEITFRDPADRGQETSYKIDNSAQANRDVRIANIPGGGQPTDEQPDDPQSTQDLHVERIDLWRVKDPVQRGQQTYIAPDSKTVAEPPDAPPYFTTHIKTHVVRFSLGDSYVDTELIDELVVKDPVERGQETHYFLKNPPGEDDGNGHLIVKPDDNAPNIDDSDNGIDPPWRTDPFQNIVDFSGSPHLLWAWSKDFPLAGFAIYPEYPLSFLPIWQAYGGGFGGFPDYPDFVAWINAVPRYPGRDNPFGAGFQPGEFPSGFPPGKLPTDPGPPGWPKHAPIPNVFTSLWGFVLGVGAGGNGLLYFWDYGFPGYHY